MIAYDSCFIYLFHICSVAEAAGVEILGEATVNNLTYQASRGRSGGFCDS